MPVLATVIVMMSSRGFGRMVSPRLGVIQGERLTQKAPGRCPRPPPRGSASWNSAKGRRPLEPIQLEFCLLPRRPQRQIAKGLALAAVLGQRPWRVPGRAGRAN